MIPLILENQVYLQPKAAEGENATEVHYSHIDVNECIQRERPSKVFLHLYIYRLVSRPFSTPRSSWRTWTSVRTEGRKEGSVTD